MKILILTSVYKDESLGKKDTSTNIVNTFAREWVNEGHEVIVIHNSHSYPKIIHMLPLYLRKKMTYFLNFQIPDYDNIKQKKYEDHGVIVYRNPIKKYIPHHSPSNKNITNQVNFIEDILKENNFIPQIITGHWCSPQMEIIYCLKQKYNCRTAIVLHGTDYISNKNFELNKYVKNIDYIGCRSLFQAKYVENILKSKRKPFICYSGIPDSYLLNYDLNLDKYDNIKKWKIVYVGRLVSYKNIDIIIKALSLIKNIDWELNIVGDGIEKQQLESLAKKLECRERIVFWGKISRDEVMDLMNKMHIFIMVSTNEVFGLVYLEAMASSCITIASKDGGIDGIIKDCQNGFLCEQENVKDLMDKIAYIFNLKKQEIKRIAKNGYDDVHNFSDSKTSQLYLNNIKGSYD